MHGAKNIKVQKYVVDVNFDLSKMVIFSEDSSYNGPLKSRTFYL
jgi:hypothetical protein